MNAVRIAQTSAEVESIIALRYEILRKPWAQPAETATDNLEETSINAYLVDDKNKVVACGRLQKNSAEMGQIRYMAVAAEYQGKGYGKRILLALEEQARLQQLQQIELQARENAVDFYLSCGYTNEAPSFKLWDQIQHYLMRRNLF